jgi:hypothetical protein
MHATRDTNDVIKLHRASGRVMRGIRCLAALSLFESALGENYRAVKQNTYA